MATVKYKGITATPFEFRDFSKGRISPYSANTYLSPKNSVSGCLNVNFDTIIGSAVVRNGTTKLGNTVASNKTPLGLGQFVGPGGSPNLLLSVFSGTSNATLYYYNGSWNTSGLTALSNTSKTRFAVLGGSAFMANGVDAMKSSTDGNTWVTTNCITSGATPSLLFKTKGRLLAGGDSTYRDRIFFSSIISPASSPFITWNTNSTTGDWIDVNPDDGGYVTGFAETSDVTLVFKNTGMYRLDAINKTIDAQNIFNIGAVSQEAITTCQGITYYFSGIDIRRTNGGYPEQISRLGCQDFIDAVPQSNWSSVCSGNDGLNVYFSIGDVTLSTGQYNQRTFTNVVLKFSTRDESWSIHSYAQKPRFYTQYTNSTNGQKMISSDTGGNVQTVNVGTTDNGTPIYYELETQEYDFSNRAHSHQISDQIVVFTNNGIDSTLQIKSNDDDYKDINITLSKRVNIGESININCNFAKFKWFGESTGTAPVLEGIYIESISDLGIVEKN